MATIKIPPVLRASVGGEREVSASGENVGAVLRDLADAHPATASQLFASGLKTLVVRYLPQNRPWKLVGCKHVRIIRYRA
jgi:hypothetical protein